MPRRSFLTAQERKDLLKLPSEEVDLIRYYSLSEEDIDFIKQRRGDYNRLGFAVQLCYHRYPGQPLAPKATPPARMLAMLAHQLQIDPLCWPQYAERDQTRREHLVDVRTYLGLTMFGLEQYQQSVRMLSQLAMQTDKGIHLASAMLQDLRSRNIVLPPINVIERACAEAVTNSTRRIYRILTERLSDEHKRVLDELLQPSGDCYDSLLTWLLQSPRAANVRQLLEHIKRLQAIKALQLPVGVEKQIHQDRLIRMAREGEQMTAQHLRDLEPERRYATLVAALLETRATITDELIDTHDRIIGTLFNRAKRAHAEEFHQSGRALNDQLRLYCNIGHALLQARKDGADPFEAIEALISWDEFASRVNETTSLIKPGNFDYLYRVADNYTQVRRYAPALLEALSFRAAPVAVEILQAIELIKTLYRINSRKIPENAPIGFIRKRWEPLVFQNNGIDRRFYELCVFSELKNALRSGDMWVEGSRQFKDFEEYLLPNDQFETLRDSNLLPLSIPVDATTYLDERLALLEQQLTNVSAMAEAQTLNEVTLDEAGLKVSTLSSNVPPEAELLMQKAYALLPHVRITELLQEVDEWTNFSRHFTHLKSNEPAADTTLLLTTVLADAINLGLTKMAKASRGATTARLSWLQAWHVREQTYAIALAELVNAQLRHPLAAYWGDGSTSSSDGQRFRVGAYATSTGHTNPKYGSDPGTIFYTHISDQYTPFHTQVIHSNVRDATYVLDGLLYHESDLRIKEHYTDTAGFTDHVFALMHLLDFRFAPRIRDLADKRLYITNPKKYPALSAIIGSSLNLTLIRKHWQEILRLATSIRKGTVTASLMLRKLGSYPRQNGLSCALRELGRMERTLFTLDWLQNVDLRRRVQNGLNKGEARNALARAVFFNRLGEIRDRTLENQRYRASGLNLVIAAIVLWNTVYLQRSLRALQQHGHRVPKELLLHLSPLGWEHIGLTGDYRWRSANREKGKFRPLKPFNKIQLP